jgi:hypothetical protein
LLFAALTSGDVGETVSTNPSPPWLRTVSSACWKNSACGGVSGSAQALLTIPVAPTARRRRHNATRALDGELGSCASSSSQPDEGLPVSIKCNTCFESAGPF